jgi:hypothetical protein
MKEYQLETRINKLKFYNPIKGHLTINMIFYVFCNININT